MKKYLLILFFIYHIIDLQSITAQKVASITDAIQVKINPEHIKKYQADPVFNYEPKKAKDNFLTKLYNKIINFVYHVIYEILKFIFGVKAAGKLIGGFIRALPYVLLVLLIYFVFRYFLGIDLIRLRKRKNAHLPQVDLSEDGRIIREENLDELIQNALNTKDYRLAVRYYYLKVLKKLMEKELIQWRTDKTNSDYIKEVNSTHFASTFSKLTYLYDYIWYGKFPAGEKELQEMQSLTNDFFTN